MILSEKRGQLAQSFKITMANLKIEDGYFSSVIDVNDRIVVYAGDGEKVEEIFRGFIWEKNYKSEVEKEIVFYGYDNLIYLMKSEIMEFFSAGQTTKSIIGKICAEWGVSLDYQYESIIHPALPLKGTLGDIIYSELLEEVRKQTGIKYVLKSINDVVRIEKIGSNKVVYQINKGEQGNALNTKSNLTMDEVITKVIITGKKDESEAVEATLLGDTANYGTLQKVISRDSNTSIEEAKKEANILLSEQGIPKSTWEVNAIDIPWVRKGDKIRIVAGDMTQEYLVQAITHYYKDKSMYLELENF